MTRHLYPIPEYRKSPTTSKRKLVGGTPGYRLHQERLSKLIYRVNPSCDPIQTPD